MALIRTNLDSSSIESVVYNPETGTLEVIFRRTGHAYDYFGVPDDVYKAFMSAESKGSFLNEVIKPNYDSIRAEFRM
jgi:hypothetical protein